MNADLNTTATNFTAEQQVLSILGVDKFVNFLNQFSKDFEITVEELLPIDFEVYQIHNIEKIEEYLVEAVMDNLFKTLEKRDFSTEYIAYTYLSVDTAKVFFMGKEVKSLAELCSEEEKLDQYAKKQHFIIGDMKEEFNRYISVNAPKDKNNFVTFKLKDLDDAVAELGLNDGEIAGNPFYYLSINNFITFDHSNSNYIYFMDTFFKGKQCVIIDSDTTNITEEMYDKLVRTNDYRDWFRIVNPKTIYEKADLENEIFEFYPIETIDTDSIYRHMFLNENLNKIYTDYENGKFDPSDYDAKVQYVKQVFETWSLAKGITKQVLVMV